MFHDRGTFRQDVKAGATEAHGAARRSYDHFKPLLTCDVGKLYVRLLKARCKIQAGVFRGDQTGKEMYNRAVQEEEGLLKEILAAVKADGSCVKFERNPGQDESSLVPRHYGIYIKSARELSLYFPLSNCTNGYSFPMNEEEVAENVRLAGLWCQVEITHNQEEKSGLIKYGYWNAN